MDRRACFLTGVQERPKRGAKRRRSVAAEYGPGCGAAPLLVAPSAPAHRRLALRGKVTRSSFSQSIVKWRCFVSFSAGHTGFAMPRTGPFKRDAMVAVDFSTQQSPRSI